jgi:taurine dioxygenase
MTTTDVSGIDLHPVTPSIGAMVAGVDLRQPLHDETFALLHDALLRHGVLFFRDQHLTDDQHLALASRFGRVNRSPYGDGELEWLVDDPEHRPSADLWHTDMAFLAEPPDVAVLSMLAAPPSSGGDTLWASLYEVHDRLSPVMQEVVGGLQQRVRRARVRAAHGVDRSAAYEPDPGAEARVHPLVRVHPVTGRRALFLCGAFVDGIEGMHPDESATLLGLLRAGLHEPAVQVRWRWRDGDVAVWDERCTNHRALGDHWPQHRAVRRCTVGASPVVGPA